VLGALWAEPLFELDTSVPPMPLNRAILEDTRPLRIGWYVEEYTTQEHVQLQREPWNQHVIHLKLQDTRWCHSVPHQRVHASGEIFVVAMSL